MEIPKSEKAIELTENAKRKMVMKYSCWQSAYQNLFSTCKENLADEDKRSRFAWDLSNCFQKDSGQRPLPRCDTLSSMLKCRKELDNDMNSVFLAFYLETNTICHQLQSEAFRRHTEELVNALKNSAQFAEDKLDNIERKAEDLLQDTHHIQDSLDSINVRTEQIDELAHNVEEHIDLVKKHSEKVYEQSQGIAASQLELQKSQRTMRENIEAAMENVEKSQLEVGQEMGNLKKQTVQIENEIVKVGDAMFSKMRNLQDKADEIGTITEDSLDKQKELLNGQDSAVEGLKLLTQVQSHALAESRDSVQKLAELGSQQQKELLSRQEQLQRTHDRLLESSKTVLEAQEIFELKQANMFVVLDKLFVLHKAMLLESRGLKALFIYTLSIFLLYMLTSTKQTYAVRPRLYIGLCVAFLIEYAMIRCLEINIEQQAWVANVVRSLVAVLVSAQLIYSIYTYRDYEVLNHQMLQKLNEKLNGMRRYEDESWETDSDVDWSTFIYTDITEDLNNLEDPDYILSQEIGENTFSLTSTSKKYNLRRHRYQPY